MRQKIDLLNGPVFPSLAKLAVPIMATSLVHVPTCMLIILLFLIQKLFRQTYLEIFCNKTIDLETRLQKRSLAKSR